MNRRTGESFVTGLPRPMPAMSGCVPLSLPSQANLLRRYAALRKRYFNLPGGNALPAPPAVTVAWSNRLTASAGICYPVERVIRLSTHYHQSFPDEVDRTLLHEMIHLIVPGHGRVFRDWVRHIRDQGGEVRRYARARATARPPHRWEYRCRRCGKTFRRRRRLAHGGANFRHKGCGGSLTEKAVQRKDGAFD